MAFCQQRFLGTISSKLGQCGLHGGVKTVMPENGGSLWLVEELGRFGRCLDDLENIMANIWLQIMGKLSVFTSELPERFNRTGRIGGLVTKEKAGWEVARRSRLSLEMLHRYNLAEAFVCDR